MMDVPTVKFRSPLIVALKKFGQTVFNSGLAIAESLWRGLCSRGMPALNYAIKFVYENFYNFAVKVPWLIAIVIVAAILIRGLTQHVTVVQPISVPKLLSDSGYTPEVAGRRLRDAMVHFAEAANTRMQRPDFALHGELPNIVVPSVGISLDAIVSSIRTLVRSTRSREITGEFTISKDQLWLRLRMDGRELYSSKDGGDPGKPDDLLKPAVAEILKVIQPYFVAVSFSDSDQAHALELAEEIISQRPAWDENVAWAHNLKSSIYSKRKDHVASLAAAETALKLKPKLVTAHVNAGLALVNLGRANEGIERYRHAIKLDPTFALPHNNICDTFNSQSKPDEAASACREAIRLDPKLARAYTGLGRALSMQKKFDDAILYFKIALKVDPNYINAHVDWAIALSQLGKDDEAAAHYQEAIRLAPANPTAHYNLGLLFRHQGKAEAAIVKFREAIRADQKHVLARRSLGNALEDTGQVEEAIIEFRAILQIDPDNGQAQSALARLTANSSKPN